MTRQVIELTDREALEWLEAVAVGGATSPNHAREMNIIAAQVMRALGQRDRFAEFIRENNDGGAIAKEALDAVCASEKEFPILKR